MPRTPLPEDDAPELLPLDEVFDETEREGHLLLALAAVSSLVRPAHPALVRPLWRLGRFYEEVDRLADAERTYRRALYIARAYPRRGRRAPGPYLARDLAALWCRVGRFREAAALAQRTLPTLPEGPLLLLGDLEHVLAFALHHLGDDRAEIHYRAALLAYGRAAGTTWTTVAKVCHNLGALLADKDPATARTLLWRAARIRAQHLGRHPAVSRTLLILAQLAKDGGQLSAAERLLQRALFCAGGQKQPDERLLAALYGELGDVLIAQGRPHAAARVWRRRAALASGG